MYPMTNALTSDQLLAKALEALAENPDINVVATNYTRSDADPEWPLPFDIASIIYTQPDVTRGVTKLSIHAVHLELSTVTPKQRISKTLTLEGMAYLRAIVNEVAPTLCVDRHCRLVALDVLHINPQTGETRHFRNIA